MRLNISVLGLQFLDIEFDLFTPTMTEEEYALLSQAAGQFELAENDEYVDSEKIEEVDRSPKQKFGFNG